MLKTHNAKFKAVSKAAPCIWKMHAFKLNIRVVIIVQIYRTLLTLE